MIKVVCKSKLNEEYQLNYSSKTVFECLKESLPKTKIVMAYPRIVEINDADMVIDCITPGYKTKITVVPLSDDKSTVKFFLKSASPGQVIDLWNRNKKNVKAILEQLIADLESNN